MGDGSRVFFLDENGDVIDSKGYWELYKEGTIRPTYTWIFHAHPYTYEDAKNNRKKVDVILLSFTYS